MLIWRGQKHKPITLPDHIKQVATNGNSRLLQLLLLPLISFQYCSTELGSNEFISWPQLCLMTSNFLSHCLQLSHPQIAAAIYTPNNPSYSSVLQCYIINSLPCDSTTCQPGKPFLIITWLYKTHVQQALVCAQNHNLVKTSGGHDYRGMAYVAGEVPFFVLDNLC